MLVTGSIPNLVNGVSQQPAVIRLSSQGSIQVNALSSVAEGLRKRPPAQHIAKIGTAPVLTSFLHLINRDLAERYLVQILSGDLKVFDLQGNAKTVTFPDGKAYLTTVGNPASVFRAVTVADNTFIINTERVTAKTAAKTPSQANQALAEVRQGNYGKTYSVVINGSTAASFTTPNGTQATDVPQIATDYIATQLYNALVALNTVTDTTPVYQPSNNYVLPSGTTQSNLIQVEAREMPNGNAATWGPWTARKVLWTSATGFQFATPLTVGTVTDVNGGASTTYNPQIRVVRQGTSGGNPYGVTRYGSTLHFNPGGPFSITVEDGFNNNAFLVTKDKAQRFADLPKRAPEGYTVEIMGGEGSEADNYFVKYASDNSSGVWKETTRQNIDFQLDAATMPFKLVRNADGTFTFSKIAWGQRLVGDDTSAPFPSFIGRKITDMFFYRNRLGLLSDENVLFSEAGEFFNFFRTTVMSVLDSDPIDVSVSHTKVSLLNFAVPFSEELLLFSGQTQFKLDAKEMLTPRTIKIDNATEFECSTVCKPVGVGKTMMFAVPRGDYSGMREYFVDSDTGTKDAADITAHVPNYIDANIFKMAAASNEDIVVALSQDNRNRIYVYKYYWSGKDKLQSSWSYWEFSTSDVILNVEFIESDMYMLVSRADGLYIEKMDVSASHEDDNAPFLVHLDRKHTIPAASMVYDAVTGTTTFTTPFDYSEGTWAAVVPDGFVGKVAGEVMDVTRVDTTHSRVKGNWTGCDLILGKRYEMHYQFSTVMYRQENGQGGSKAIQNGRLQLLRMGVTYSETGYFKAVVSAKGKASYTSVFTARILGSDLSRINRVNLEDGEFFFPIKSENLNVDIDLYSDSPYPCVFLNAHWEAQYTFRSRQI